MMRNNIVDGRGQKKVSCVFFNFSIVYIMACEGQIDKNLSYSTQKFHSPQTHFSNFYFIIHPEIVKNNWLLFAET